MGRASRDMRLGEEEIINRTHLGYIQPSLALGINSVDRSVEQLKAINKNERLGYLPLICRHPYF